MAVEIAAIIVAVDYDGELAVTLPHVRSQADHVYVVTKPDATRTHEIVAANDCSVLACDQWHARGAKFNKAAAVRLGQLHCWLWHRNAWQLLLDADIVLPTGVRELVAGLPDEDDVLYVARRLDYHDDAAIADGKPSRVYPVCAAGFFHLHRSDRLYPPWSESAERCDLEFAESFREIRLLPVMCHHLGVEAQNWRGRVTPAWNPRPLEIQ